MAQMSNEYGTALFELAKEDGKENEYSKLLDMILSIFSENPEYIDFLSSPSIAKSDKIESIDKTFGDYFPEYIVSFIQLLCERGRIRDFNNCVDEYNKLLDFSNNVSVAKVVSSIELTADEKEKIKEKFLFLQNVTRIETFLFCVLFFFI